MQCDVGILSRIFIDGRGWEVAHVFLLASLLADEFLDVDGLVFQIDLGEIVHVVSQFGLDEVVGYHRIEHRSLHTDAIVCEYLHVVLDVLSDFQDGRIFVDGFKTVNNIYGFFVIGGDGHVKGFSFLHRKAQTHQFGGHRVGSRGLCI